MLRIGFSNKYYTLWDISEEIVYSELSGGTIMCQPTYATHMTVQYCYIQNLSLDLEKAQEKAKAMGCTNLTPDEELYGRNSNFYSDKSLVCHLPTQLLSTFEFGKFRGREISTVGDLSYLLWYYNESGSVMAKKILLENGYVEVNKSKTDDPWIVLMSPEEYTSYKHGNQIKAEFESLDEVVVFVERNIYLTTDISGENYIYVMDVNFKGEKLRLEFPEVKQMYYNGMIYYLPVINGKAKKVKGKNILVQKTGNKVNKFEILK
jgi:hypothetical protein